MGSGSSGSIALTTGAATGGAAGGQSTVKTGGSLSLAAGYGSATSSGAFSLRTLDAGVAGVSGALSFKTGASTSGSSGSIALVTGAVTGSGLGGGGDITIAVGAATATAGGSVLIAAGNSGNAAQIGGDILIKAGNYGATNPGSVSLGTATTNRLLIDPAGATITTSAAMSVQATSTVSVSGSSVDFTPTGNFEVTSSAGNIAIVALGGTIGQTATGDISLSTSTGDILLSATGTNKIVKVAAGNFQVGVAGGSTIATATSWQTFSDRRLKADITSLSAQSMAVVMALRPVAFRWLASGNGDVGFIAQEVEAVMPDIVTSRDDGYKTVNYPRIGVHVVKALQEMKAAMDERFEKIESRLSSIDPQNASQESIEGLADAVHNSTRAEKQEIMSGGGNREGRREEYEQRQSMEAQIQSMKQDIEELRQHITALMH